MEESLSYAGSPEGVVLDNRRTLDAKDIMISMLCDYFEVLFSSGYIDVIIRCTAMCKASGNMLFELISLCSFAMLSAHAVTSKLCELTKMFESYKKCHVIKPLQGLLYLEWFL